MGSDNCYYFDSGQMKSMYLGLELCLIIANFTVLEGWGLVGWGGGGLQVADLP